MIRASFVDALFFMPKNVTTLPLCRHGEGVFFIAKLSSETRYKPMMNTYIERMVRCGYSLSRAFMTYIDFRNQRQLDCLDEIISDMETEMRCSHVD